ncbi:MAG TPA: hypothetical protein VKT49_11640 [Bryobacteraceae bacterium]|nr:hypothetical protein [Bryobacteraceae bacterium]
MRPAAAILILCAGAWAQEANSGFDLNTTLSQQASYSPHLEDAPRDGAPVTGGFRAVFYPTWKLSEHWTVSGAVQTYSRPYFYQQFSTQGYGVSTDILQGYISYSRFWNGGSLVVRAGQLSSAFGSFLLHYDDADNPLIDIPLSYGYYESGVTNLGLAGAQTDLALGKADFRAQFVNSSPANRRSLFDRDQYGNWAGGAGYTIRQGLRVGASAYRGPYLDRHSKFYFPGEAPPRDLPATAIGLDAQWGWRHLNLSGEWQHFEFTYRKIPTYTEHTGYVEARQVLDPRWYVASRLGYIHASAGPPRQVYEAVAGFRPNRHQLVKLGYEIQQGPAIHGAHRNVLAVQLVTTLHAISIAHD